MLAEQLNLSAKDMDVSPPAFGWTILAIPTYGRTLHETLSFTISVWTVVALWGRWCDEDLGDWPESGDAVKALPEWFQDCIINRPSFSLDAWFSDLHDRDWEWWRGSEIDGAVKIDINADSMPISVWMLKVVIELAGGTVIYSDRWLTREAASRLRPRPDPA